MDQVNLPNNVLFLDDESVMESSGYKNNNDIIQQALSGISPISAKDDLGHIFPQESDDKASLSLQDAADLGLPFSMDKFSGQSDLDDLIQIPMNTKSQKFNYIPNIIDGQLTYQIQIPEEDVKLEQVFPAPQINTPKTIKLVACPKVNVPRKVIIMQKPENAIKPGMILTTINAKPKAPMSFDSKNNGIFVINQAQKGVVPDTSNGFILGNNVLKNIVVNSQKGFVVGSSNGKSNIVLSNGILVKKDQKILLNDANLQSLKNSNVSIVTTLNNNSVLKKNVKNPVVNKITTNKIMGLVKNKKIHLINPKIPEKPPVKKPQEIPQGTSEPKLSPVKRISKNPIFLLKTEKTQDNLSQPQKKKETQDPKSEPMSPSSLAALAEKIVPITKNPIGKLTPSQLKRIAAVLEQNKSSSSALVDNGDDSKILCRILYPEDFKPGSEKKLLLKLKRKLRTKSKATKAASEKKEPAKVEVIKTRRTRSGRVSKPSIHITELDGHTTTEIETENDENMPAPNLLPGLDKKQGHSSHFRCGTCNKLYLSRSSRATHLKKYPDHFIATDEKIFMSAPKKPKKRFNVHLKQLIEKHNENDIVEATSGLVAKNLSLWDFLLLRLEKAENGGKTKVASLLDELEKVVQEVKKISSNILFNPVSELQETVNVSEEAVCSMLGLKPGVYVPNDEGLNNVRPEKRPHPEEEEEDTGKRLKPNDLIDEVTNETVKDLSDPALLQDMYVNQSELESVDQIVNERLRTLAPGEDMIPNLSADDDLMEGLLKSVQPLSDSIFNPPVSEAAEDLYKTLENLAKEIQPAQLDFSDLSHDFSNPESILKL